MSENENFHPRVRDALRKMIQSYVSEVSEEIWCAGWYGGIEFYLWAAAQGDPEYTRHFEDGVVDAVVAISELLGEWPSYEEMRTCLKRETFQLVNPRLFYGSLVLFMILP